jgi:hypothetical protein
MRRNEWSRSSECADCRGLSPAFPCSAVLERRIVEIQSVRLFCDSGRARRRFRLGRRALVRLLPPSSSRPSRQGRSAVGRGWSSVVVFLTGGPCCSEFRLPWIGSLRPSKAGRPPKPQGGPHRPGHLSSGRVNFRLDRRPATGRRQGHNWAIWAAEDFEGVILSITRRSRPRIR